ncbi:MAG TPA: hypothetical protein VL326_04810 [Kofleriaceae bacterium]|nr:hypothetical protein [Kofleriaceae bacterium]
MSVARLLGVAIAIALGGCTAILGLDQVSSIDRDNDSVPDALDNCPDDTNPDQSDFDHNGKGDVCDLCTDGGTDDADMDGIPDGCDGCIGRGEDLDGDHIDDGCDSCIGNGMDADHDNIDDACDDCVANGMDADHDSVDDGCDACVSQPSQVGVDDDGDGIENDCDPCPAGPQHDEDGDDVFDACDTCKAIRDPVQKDDDDDGVGNRCDPETGIVHYERMDPFVVLDPAWFEEGSPWTVLGDSVRLSSVGSSFRWLSPLRPEVSLATRMKFVPSPIMIGTPSAGLIAYSSVSSGAAVQAQCNVLAGGNVVATLVVNNTNVGYGFSSGGVTTTAFFDLTMEISDGKKLVRCIATEGANLPVIATVQINDNALLGSAWFPGLRVEAAEATFQYFDQIGAPP